MNLQAVILAGGLGTRLSGTVTDLPKCMAPVAGRPFLFYVINYFRSQGINDFIFSLGYRHEAIEQYLEEYFSTLNYTTVIESSPLGTGGAIRLACEQASTENVLVANGDTVFKIHIDAFIKKHQLTDADCTLALKPMKNFDRYGSVEMADDGKIIKFNEKKFQEKGLINGGIYLLKREQFLSVEFPARFSFEQEYLEKNKGAVYGYEEDAYFIDIGIPEDFFRAGQEFSRSQPLLSAMDKNWTLFIDRDGVINYEKKMDYIRNWDEFRFYENVPSSFRNLAEKFGRIIIITNQRGVGKNLMSEEDLGNIHTNMTRVISSKGGRVDRIYYCTSTENKHPDRKPNPGMAFRAQKDLPGIDLSKSVMVGNTLPDMQFGRHAGMFTVFIATTHPEVPFPHPDIDFRFDTLEEFTKAL
jgi:D-glycero-alpha-D-manno-heptose 1-phosphate guanylyltransferase